MCYRCATNPSIHHHHHCVAAMSSPLSHHGVAFAVTSSRFHHRHHGVTFVSVVVSLLPSRCCLRPHIVVVLSSQSHRCGAFAVASSPFCHRCRGVAFVIALSRFHHRHRGVAFTSVTVSSSPSRCCLHVGHGFVVTIAVLPLLSLSQCFHCGFFVSVVSLLPHGVNIAGMSLHCQCRCHGHGHIVVMVNM